MDANLYYTVFLTVVTIMTAVISSKYSSYPDSRFVLRRTSSGGALFLTVALTLFIGLRPLSYLFTDMYNYHMSYYHVFGQPYSFNPDSENIFFDNILYYLASERYDLDLFFLLIAAIYFGGIFIAMKKLFPRDTLYAVVIYLGAFSTFSYATNGIKAGAAASIFLCAIAYRRQLPACIMFLIASLGFHHSMIMPIAAFAICHFYSEPKKYLSLWIICLIIAACHITFFQELFGSMANDQGAGYLIKDKAISNWGYYAGFRFDFALYSAAPIVLGYWLITNCGYRSKTYNFIYSLYTLTNAVWLLCMYASFTNRIAYLSWLMLPIALTYPFFDSCFRPRQYRLANTVARCHLGFTLAMTIVYYGFLKALF